MTKAGTEVRAAGGVVWRRRENGEVEVLLVHRPRYDDWSLPKGKAEPGESDDETAQREVTEETGYVGKLGADLGEVRYADRFGRSKVVRYWAMEPVEDLGFVPGDEVDERRWATSAESRALLSYPRDAEILDTFEALELP
ncbi:MAG TPA: NUDIX hydrolase [Acidimicrobiales bacterium]|nr:NUDIX hydrolase [Acidimicrobiales bacterium]